ncbi:hypothetical protein P9112_008179 [Eukaryota sp. TZLM1-RC]
MVADPVQKALDTFNVSLFKSKFDSEEWTTEQQRLQQDESSPFHSSKTFAELGLSDEVLETLQELELLHPTKIQQFALEKVQESTHVICGSHGGSGKSLALVLAALQSIDRESQKPQVFITACNFEVISLLYGIASMFTEKCGFSLELCTNKPFSSQIVIGHPVALIENCQEPIDGSVHLFVDDAAIALQLDIKESEDSDAVVPAISKLKQTLSESVRIFYFGSTFSQDVRKRIISISPSFTHSSVDDKDQLGQNYLVCSVNSADRSSRNNKAIQLSAAFASHTQVLIFADTSVHSGPCKYIRRKLETDHQLAVGLLSHEFSIRRRERVLADIQSGNFQVILASPAMACGIDFLDVGCVIILDPPFKTLARDAEEETFDVDFEGWVMRATRTGRAGRYGLVVNCTHDSHSQKAVIDVAKRLNRIIPFVEPEQIIQLLE